MILCHCHLNFAKSGSTLGEFAKYKYSYFFVFDLKFCSKPSKLTNVALNKTTTMRNALLTQL